MLPDIPYTLLPGKLNNLLFIESYILKRWALTEPENDRLSCFHPSPSPSRNIDIVILLLQDLGKLLAKGGLGILYFNPNPHCLLF